jgi:hypothetical protein
MAQNLHRDAKRGTWQFAALDPENEGKYITAKELKAILETADDVPVEVEDRAVEESKHDRVKRGGQNR